MARKATRVASSNTSSEFTSLLSKVRDEAKTLASLGIAANSPLFIRAYDLGHYPDFKG